MPYLRILALTTLLLGLSAATSAKSPKRGACWDERNLPLGGQHATQLSPGVSWVYNWGPDAANSTIFDENFRFEPMAWNGAYSAARIRAWLDAHPESRYLLGFNEPNFYDQARMTPAEAAAAWPALESIAAEYGVKLGIDEIMDGVNAMLERYYCFEVPLKPGVEELLKRFRASGVKLCIATATDRYLVEAALKRCKALSYFGEVFTCNEVGHGKDEPDIFEAALRFLGTEKSETVVFDDALYAIKAAKEAGFPVAAVCDSHEKNQEEIRVLSDVYLKDLAQLDKLQKLLPV